MMALTLEDVINAHDKSIDRLDPNKNCGTCKHEDKNEESEPCNECFNFMLFFHVNPTKWESK
jgi:hypothetical protein